MAEEKNLQVNANFSDTPELFEALLEMVAQDMTDRSKFIKKLVRDEMNRRAMNAIQGSKPAKARKEAEKGRQSVAA